MNSELLLEQSGRLGRNQSEAEEVGRDADPSAVAGVWVEAIAGGGRYRSASETAEAEGVTRSFVNWLLRLTLLAPDIQKAILDGRQPKGMQLAGVTDAILSEWEKQRKALFPGAG